jgi:hypothetical protein
MNRMPRTLLSLALLQAIGVESALANDDVDRFDASSYVYCDAVMLSKFWRQSVYEAKATMGRKIGWGSEDVIEGGLRNARRQGWRCSFDQTEFDYDDAEALASLWGTSVEQAKAALAEKVSMGRVDLARDAVAEAFDSGD